MSTIVDCTHSIGQGWQGLGKIRGFLTWRREIACPIGRRKYEYIRCGGRLGFQVETAQGYVRDFASIYDARDYLARDTETKALHLTEDQANALACYLQRAKADSGDHTEINALLGMIDTLYPAE